MNPWDFQQQQAAGPVSPYAGLMPEAAPETQAISGANYPSMPNEYGLGQQMQLPPQKQQQKPLGAQPGAIQTQGLNPWSFVGESNARE